MGHFHQPEKYSSNTRLQEIHVWWYGHTKRTPQSQGITGHALDFILGYRCHLEVPFPRLTGRVFGTRASKVLPGCKCFLISCVILEGYLSFLDLSSHICKKEILSLSHRVNVGDK